MADTATGSDIIGVDIFGPQTSDADALISFYRDRLGMKPTHTNVTDGNVVSGAEFELSDGTTFGVYEQPGAIRGRGYGALFAVADIQAAVATFRSRGVELTEPLETPVCWISFGSDTDGNTFGIHQRKG